MKLIRFGAIGHEKPGVQLANGTKIDCNHHQQSQYQSFPSFYVVYTNKHKYPVHQI